MRYAAEAAFASRRRTGTMMAAPGFEVQGNPN